MMQYRVSHETATIHHVTAGSPNEADKTIPGSSDRAGVLTREQLRQLADQGVIGNAAGPVVIEQDTLKLHVGKVAWIAADARTIRQRVDQDNPVRIAPGDTVTVITQEEVRVPLDLTGCIWPRGRLLPLGVLNTAVHIDPGFNGHLRVVMMNVGRKIVDLPYGYEIARLQLSTLARGISTPYSGVNSDLEHVNPQADDIVATAAWKSDSQAVLDALTARVQILEKYAQGEFSRRRHRRLAYVVVAALAILAAVSFLAVLVGRSLGGASVKDLVIQVLAGVLTGAVAITASLVQRRFRERLKVWASPNTSDASINAGPPT